MMRMYERDVDGVKVILTKHFLVYQKVALPRAHICLQLPALTHLGRSVTGGLLQRHPSLDARQKQMQRLPVTNGREEEV